MSSSEPQQGAASYRAAGVDYETLDAGKQRGIRTFLTANRSLAVRKSRPRLAERASGGSRV
jgi:hypothetical protein